MSDEKTEVVDSLVTESSLKSNDILEQPDNPLAKSNDVSDSIENEEKQSISPQPSQPIITEKMEEQESPVSIVTEPISSGTTQLDTKKRPLRSEDSEEEQELRRLYPSARAQEEEEEESVFDEEGKDISQDSTEKKKGNKIKRKYVKKRRGIRLDPEEERRHQLELEKKAWAQSLVQSALFSEDGSDREFIIEQPMEQFPNVFLEVVSGTTLRNEVLEGLLNLTRDNMKELYDGSGSASWIWSDLRKRQELRTERMQWILLRTKENVEGSASAASESGSSINGSSEAATGILGFVAFRFTAEIGIPHTYLHELQISKRMQGKGYGKLLMGAVETVSLQTHMQLIMLTVLAKNKLAFQFYEKLGFKIDEASPGPCYNLLDPSANQSPYEIMSKILDPNVLQYSCENCDYRCRFPDTIKQHQGLIHLAEWPFPCSFPNCGGGTVHQHQLLKHTEIKHKDLHDALTSCSTTSTSSTTTTSKPEGYLGARVTFKSDGRKGTVIKMGEKGFYTVRMDGPTLETVVCRAASFLGHTSQPVKKKQVDPDHDFALRLQYEEGWSRKSDRIKRN